MPTRFTQIGSYLLAAATLLTAPFVSASDLHGSASLTGLTWKLIDLNPGDSINPELKMVEASGASWSQNASVIPWLIDLRETYGSTQISGLGGTASTLVDAVNETSRVRATDPSQAFMAYALGYMTFELTPYTSVEFSGLAQVDSSHVGSEQTGGHVLFQGYLADADDGRPVSEFTLKLNSVDGAATRQLNGTLTSGAESTIGSFRRDTIAYANLTPVPEPTTYAMLLAGLGLLGWRVRRVRR